MHGLLGRRARAAAGLEAHVLHRGPRIHRAAGPHLQGVHHALHRTNRLRKCSRSLCVFFRSLREAAAQNGNYYKDGGEIQFYAQAFGITASENKFERTGGLSAWARGYSGKDANLRNSFVDNEVSATAPFASSFLKEASKQLLRIVAGR